MLASTTFCDAPLGGTAIHSFISRPWSSDLLVVGAYPNGMRWDLRRGDAAERAEVLANIEAVPLPDADPVHGPDGPLTEIWPAAG